MADAVPLFKLDGTFVAFAVDGHLYDASARWIGWSPGNDDVFYDSAGVYFGEIVDDQRLLRRLHKPKIARPAKPVLPARPARPEAAPRRSKMLRVAGCDDVSIRR
jgi:hypothetical protein